MYDDLARIERCYGCVAEYNRCKQEQDEYEWEQQQKENELCGMNKQKLKDNAEIAVYYSDDCIGCKHYEEVGPTKWNLEWMDIDDVEHGLCHNCNRNVCPVWKERKGD